MVCAPFLGAVIGATAGALAWVAATAIGAAAGAVAATAALAVLTRALHLDGLADTADGLGSGRHGAEGVAIMRRSDIGPFGVITLVLVLLAQTSLIAASLAETGPRITLVTLAVVSAVGRSAIVLVCVRGSRAASASGLGAAVVGTVPIAAAWSLGTVTIAASAAVLAIAGAVGAVLGLAAGLLFARMCSARFQGLTGDTLGAVIEVAGLTSLVTIVILGA
jgi:adenosylcobinamide-GDP ribazoletransferase